MKILAFAGHISFQLTKTKKPRGRPRKEFSDYARRADIFRSTEQMLIEQGHKNLSQTEVINVCIEIAKILHKQGSVSDASAEYFNDEDILLQFLDEETAQEQNYFETTNDLYLRFRFWSEQQGLLPWTQTTFQKELKTRGYTPHRRNSGRGFCGLKLK